MPNIKKKIDTWSSAVDKKNQEALAPYLTEEFQNKFEALVRDTLTNGLFNVPYHTALFSSKREIKGIALRLVFKLWLLELIPDKDNLYVLKRLLPSLSSICDKVTKSYFQDVVCSPIYLNKDNLNRVELSFRIEVLEHDNLENVPEPFRASLLSLVKEKLQEERNPKIEPEPFKPSIKQTKDAVTYTKKQIIKDFENTNFDECEMSYAYGVNNTLEKSMTLKYEVLDYIKNPQIKEHFTAEYHYHIHFLKELKEGLDKYLKEKELSDFYSDFRNNRNFTKEIEICYKSKEWLP